MSGDTTCQAPDCSESISESRQRHHARFCSQDCTVRDGNRRARERRQLAGDGPDESNHTHQRRPAEPTSKVQQRWLAQQSLADRRRGRREERAV